jgi:adenylate cyclase
MARRGFIKQFKEWIATGGRGTNWDLGSYESWQRQFLEHRVRLTVLFASLYLATFIPLDLVNYVNADRHPLALLWVGVNVARVASLGLSYLILQWGPAAYRAEMAFLWTSLSINGWARLYDTYVGLVHADRVVNPDLFSWAIIFITQATLIPVRWRLHLIPQIIIVIYYFGVNTLLGLTVVPPNMTPYNLVLHLAWVLAICNLSVYCYEQVAKTVYRANRQLRIAQERSERLLLNILPESIATQLKRENRTIAEDFTEVTVLFADIVGFTQLTQRMSPIELVELLNQVFSKFDDLTDCYRLEKIKTIGDAYMVVAGLPDHRHDHASAIANMALDMQAEIAQLNTQTEYHLTIRIGIHTGPVVAGVIGLKKFAYDLWGDTVNMASRLESHSLPGKIQVSASTYQFLQKDYVLVARGPIELKGKGVVETYFLEAKQPVAPGGNAIESS